jgi:hypothetical protein
MIRLRVSESQAYLFYSDHSEPFVNDIHNHRYSFTSDILKGTLRTEVYKFTETDEYTDLNVVRRYWDKREPEIMAANINLYKVCTFDAIKGDTYNIDYRVFHHVTKQTPKLITRMTTQPLPWPVEANQFIESKSNPSAPIDAKTMSKERCWEVIEYTLDDND